MTWDISPDDKPPGGLPAEYDWEPPSTFIATVIEVLDIYDPRHENGIKYYRIHNQKISKKSMSVMQTVCQLS